MALPIGDVTANPYASPTPAADGSDSQPKTGPTPSKKWAGKYNSEQELEQGYENQQAVLTERTHELAETRERVAELERMLVTAADRMSPAARVEQRSRARELLESQGIPVDALTEVIEERLASTAPKYVEKALAPLTQGAQAQRMLADEFPDVNITDVQQFLRVTPDVNRRFQEKLQNDPISAHYYAYGQYMASQRESADLSGQSAARARLDAALPQSRAAGAPAESTGNRVAEGWDNWQRSGNIMDFLRERLSHVPGVKPPQE